MKMVTGEFLKMDSGDNKREVCSGGKRRQEYERREKGRNAV